MSKTSSELPGCCSNRNKSTKVQNTKDDSMMQNFKTGQFLEASVSADLVGHQLHRRPPDRNQAKVAKLSSSHWVRSSPNIPQHLKPIHENAAFCPVAWGDLEHLGTCKAYRAVKIGSRFCPGRKDGRGNEWWRGRSIDNMTSCALQHMSPARSSKSAHSLPSKLPWKLCQTQGICATVIVVRWHYWLNCCLIHTWGLSPGSMERQNEGNHAKVLKQTRVLCCKTMLRIFSHAFLDSSFWPTTWHQ